MAAVSWPRGTEKIDKTRALMCEFSVGLLCLVLDGRILELEQGPILARRVAGNGGGHLSARPHAFNRLPTVYSVARATRPPGLQTPKLNLL